RDQGGPEAASQRKHGDEYADRAGDAKDRDDSRTPARANAPEIVGDGNRAEKRRQQTKDDPQSQQKDYDRRNGDDKPEENLLHHAQTLLSAFTTRKRIAPRPGSKPLNIPTRMAATKPDTSMEGERTMLGSMPLKALARKGIETKARARPSTPPIRAMVNASARTKKRT